MKVFASDYDGTLFKNREITKKDLDAINKFRAEGNLFGIVTGRPIDSIMFEINKYSIPVDFLVGINGGVVLDENFEILYVSSFEHDVVPLLMKTLEEERVHYYGVNDGFGMTRVAVEMEDTETQFNIELSTFEDLESNGINAMYVRSQSNEHAIEVAQKINDLYSEMGVKAYPNTWAIDIGVKGVSKSTGIKMILDHFKLDKDTEVYTVGDAHNDVPMLKDYHGFVMDNGVEDVKKHAKEIVETVADAIEIALKI